MSIQGTKKKLIKQGYSIKETEQNIIVWRPGMGLNKHNFKSYSQINKLLLCDKMK